MTTLTRQHCVAAWLSTGALLVAAACGPGERGAADDAGDPSSAAAGDRAMSSSVSEPAPPVSIPNARVPEPGVLAGGQPTPDQIRELAAAGYETVITLRPEGELTEWDERAVVEGAGMRFESIPVSGTDGLTEENARRLAELLDDPAVKPAVVHCASGNRVGALFALAAQQEDGASVEEAMRVGKEAGLTRLEQATREILERHASGTGGR